MIRTSTNKKRDIESFIFAAWASYSLHQNGYSYGKKEELHENIYSLVQYKELIPSQYKQFTELFLPNVEQKEQIQIQSDLIQAFKFSSDNSPFHQYEHICYVEIGKLD